MEDAASVFPVQLFSVRRSAREIPFEPEPGERGSVACTILVNRAHSLRLRDFVFRPGSLLELELVQAVTGAAVENPNVLVDLRTIGGRCLREEEWTAFARRSIRCTLDADGISSPFAVAVRSYTRARRLPQRFWLRMRLVGPDGSCAEIGPGRLNLLVRARDARRLNLDDDEPGPAPVDAPAPAAAAGRPAEYCAAPALTLNWPAPANSQISLASPTPTAPDNSTPPPRRKRPPSSPRAEADLGGRAQQPRRDGAGAGAGAPEEDAEVEALGADLSRLAVAVAAEEFETSARRWRALASPPPPPPAEPHSTSPAPDAALDLCKFGIICEFAQSSEDYSGAFERIVSRALGRSAFHVLGPPAAKGEGPGSPAALPLALPPRIGRIPDAHLFLDLRERVRVQVPEALGDRKGGPAPAPPPAFPALLSPDESAALEARLLELHAAAAKGLPGACEQFQEALCDARVLATGLVQDGIGGYRAHRMLQTLRGARRSDAGPHAVASSLVACVASCRPESLTQEQLRAAVEQCIALLEFGTAFAASSMDLWLLDLPSVEAVAQVMLDCAQRVEDPELKAHALVTGATSKAGVRHPLDEVPIHMYLEARGLLRRHGLIPSRLECELMRQLLALLSVMSELLIMGVNEAMARAEKERRLAKYALVIEELSASIYWFSDPETATPRDILQMVHINHSLALNATRAGEHSRADAMYSRAEEALFFARAEALPAEVRAAFSTGQVLVVRLFEKVRRSHFIDALKYARLLAEEDRRRRELWAMPASDYLNCYTSRFFWLLFDPAALCRMLKLLAVVFKVLGTYDKTPQGAHLNFALGDVLAVSGRHAEAVEAYDECIQLYAAFDEYFPPDSRRVAAARRALEACRAAVAAGASRAGQQQGGPPREGSAARGPLPPTSKGIEFFENCREKGFRERQKRTGEPYTPSTHCTLVEGDVPPYQLLTAPAVNVPVGLLLTCFYLGLQLAIAQAQAQLTTPPGSPDSLLAGASAFCVGERYDTTLPTRTSTDGQGTNARFTGVRSIHYNNYDGYLYAGVRNGIFRIDSTCTATLIVGSYAGVSLSGSGVFGVDGLGTLATFGDVYALAAAPGNVLYAVDRGSTQSAIRRVDLSSLVVSTVLLQPTSMQTLAYSPLDGRLYWALAVFSGGARGNVTSCLPDGTDVRVAALIPPSMIPAVGSGVSADDAVPVLYVSASSGTSGSLYKIDVSDQTLWPVEAATLAAFTGTTFGLQGAAPFSSPGLFRLFFQAWGPTSSILAVDSAGVLVSGEEIAPPPIPAGGVASPFREAIYGISPVRNRPDIVFYASWDQYRIYVHKALATPPPTPSPSPSSSPSPSPSLLATPSPPPSPIATPAPGTSLLDLASVSPLAGAAANGSVILPVPFVALGVSPSIASAPAGQYVFTWSQDAGAPVPPSALSGASTPVLNVSGEALAPGGYTFTLTVFEPAAGRARSFPSALSVSIAPIPLRIPNGAVVTISLSVNVDVDVGVGVAAAGAAASASPSTPALRPGQTVPFEIAGLPDLSPYSAVAPFVFRYTAGLYRASSNSYVANVTVLAGTLPRNGRAGLVLPGASAVPQTDDLFYIRLELRGRDDVVSVLLARARSRRSALQLQAPAPAGFASVIASGQSGRFRLLTFKGDSTRAEQAGLSITIFSAVSVGLSVLADAATALAGAGVGPFGFGPGYGFGAGAGAAGAAGAASGSGSGALGLGLGAGLGPGAGSAAAAAVASCALVLPRFGVGARLAVSSAQFTYFSAFYGGQRTAYGNMSASLEWANLYFRLPWGSSWATGRSPVRRRAALELTEISSREGADSPSERFKESAFWSGVALAGVRQRPRPRRAHPLPPPRPPSPPPLAPLPKPRLLPPRRPLTGPARQAAVLQLGGYALWDWSGLAPRLPLVGKKVEAKPVVLRAPRLQVLVASTALQGFLVAAVATAYLRGNSSDAAAAASSYPCQ
eukprot:tig00000057_g109.t2